MFSAIIIIEIICTSVRKIIQSHTVSEIPWRIRFTGVFKWVKNKSNFLQIYEMMSLFLTGGRGIYKENWWCFRFQSEGRSRWKWSIMGRGCKKWQRFSDQWCRCVQIFCPPHCVLYIIGKFIQNFLKAWRLHFNKNKRLGSAFFIQHFI